MMDAFILCYLYLPSALSNDGVAKMPIIGTLARALQTIFVDRHAKDSKAAALAAIKHRVDTPGFPPILIFPEGTTVNGKALIQFRVGAFACGKPVLPVVLRFPHAHLDPSSTGKAGESEGAYYLRLLLQFYNEVRVTELPVYSPSDSEVASPITFANNVRQRMAAALDVPTTEHSYDDLWLSIEAIPASVDQTFEVTAVKKLLGVSLDDLKVLVHKFHAGDFARDGRVDIQGFCTALNLPLPASPDVRRVFNFFDTHETGHIDFLAFVTGISMMSASWAAGGETAVQKRRLTFAMFDKDSDGRVSWEDIQAMIRRQTEAAPEAPEAAAAPETTPFSPKGRKLARRSSVALRSATLLSSQAQYEAAFARHAVAGALDFPQFCAMLDDVAGAGAGSPGVGAGAGAAPASPAAAGAALALLQLPVDLAVEGDYVRIEDVHTEAQAAVESAEARRKAMSVSHPRPSSASKPSATGAAPDSALAAAAAAAAAATAAPGPAAHPQ